MGCGACQLQSTCALHVCIGLRGGWLAPSGTNCASLYSKLAALPLLLLLNSMLLLQLLAAVCGSSTGSLCPSQNHAVKLELASERRFAHAHVCSPLGASCSDYSLASPPCARDSTLPNACWLDALGQLTACRHCLRQCVFKKPALMRTACRMAAREGMLALCLLDRMHVGMVAWSLRVVRRRNERSGREEP